MENTTADHGRRGFDPLAYDLIAIIDTDPPEDASSADTVLQIGERFENPDAGWSDTGLTDEAEALIEKRDAPMRESVAYRNPARKCDHCGKSFSNIRFVAYALHRESGDVVAFGHTCGRDLGYADAFELAIAHARRAAATAAETAKRNAELREWAAANPAEAEILDRYDAELGESFPFDNARSSEFLANMVRARRLYGPLTPKQTQWIVKAEETRVRNEARKQERIDADAAVRENVEPFEAGRQKVTGRWVTVKYDENDYGTTVRGLFVLDDGRKLWGTIPARIDDLLVSHRNADDEIVEPLEVKQIHVELTATVEPKDQDRWFGFYKRPSAKVLEITEKEED